MAVCSPNSCGLHRLSYKNSHKLRSYQVQGLNWMLECWHHNRSCILADEMGLGKTAQTVTLMHHLRDLGGSYPFLVVAPLSTIQHWRREIEEWTDFNVCVYHDSGGEKSRRLIREFKWFFPGQRRDVVKFDVLVTTYTVFNTDVLELSCIKWQAVTVDEGHRLRNVKSKLLFALQQLSCDFRLLLTGTPLQNNTQELWSLLNFIEPDKFNDMRGFLKKFGDIDNVDKVGASTGGGGGGGALWWCRRNLVGAIRWIAFKK